MPSALTAEILHLMLRGLMKLVDETPANEENLGLLQKCQQTLEWLQAQAQETDNRPETTELFDRSISTVSQKINCADEQVRARVAMRTHNQDQVEPFDLVKLLAAWDREFPGGSAAVLAQMEEILSRAEARKQNLPAVAE